jgi:hypothetical protein
MKFQGSDTSVMAVNVNIKTVNILVGGHVLINFMTTLKN